MPRPLFPDANPSSLRIIAVGFHGLRALLETLAPQYESTAQVHVLDRAYDDALSQIQAMRERGRVDVVVAAGSNGEYLRQHLDLPVVLVQVDGLDMMHALSRALRTARRVALVTYGAVPTEIEHFNDLFGLKIELRAYRTTQDAEMMVQALKRLGVECIAAPGMVVDLAKLYGLEGVLLYSQESVRKAIDQALDIARIARLERARREKLNTILAQIKDGVLAVDLDERIDIINPAMEKIIGQGSASLIGQRLGAVAGELSLRDTLLSGRSQVERVQEVGRSVLVTTRLPITEQGRRTGAVLICQDPATIQRLDGSLRARSRSRSAPARYQLADIVGASPVIDHVKARALACAQSSATVLITGESGTGKELFAQGIHNAGTRRSKPFVAINCAAFPESLLESELFGYVEGAFTGSSRGGKAGLFEAAHTGTIFLDEIGEMPLSLQTRLLRVLQEREVLRIGATVPTHVDVRVMAATHRDLRASTLTGDFRSDLYYRLNILALAVPSLRERRGDIPLLARELAAKIAERIDGLDGAACETAVRAIEEASASYEWPGNVRELENLIERVLVFHGSGYSLGDRAADDLRQIVPELFAGEHEGAGTTGLKESRRTTELEHIRNVLAACGGDRTRAAKQLNISRSTLWRKLKQMQE